MSNTVYVTVNVLDADDNVPLFVDFIYSGYVLEEQNGVPVTETGTSQALAVLVSHNFHQNIFYFIAPILFS